MGGHTLRLVVFNHVERIVELMLESEVESMLDVFGGSTRVHDVLCGDWELLGRRRRGVEAVGILWVREARRRRSGVLVGKCIVDV